MREYTPERLRHLLELRCADVGHKWVQRRKIDDLEILIGRWGIAAEQAVASPVRPIAWPP